jgi:uroporphyrinogen-III synthase
MTTQPRPALLLTRPEAQSLRFAAELGARAGAAAASLRVVISPLMSPVLLDEPLPALLGPRGGDPARPGQETVLVFSSETGVAGFARLCPRRDLRALCVGERTAAAARAAGFRATVAGPDAAGLLSALPDLTGDAHVVVVRGKDTACPIARNLAVRGIEASEMTVYDQRAQPPGTEALALLAGSAPVVVPLFSPRSAALFSTVAAASAAPLWIVAISEAAHAGLGNIAPARAIVARTPDGEGMLSATAHMLGLDEQP